MVMEILDNYSSWPVDHCSGGKTESIDLEAHLLQRTLNAALKCAEEP